MFELDPNVIVAAGSLINKDVSPNSIIGGVPARVIGNFDEYVAKRKRQYYPFEISPRHQEVCKSLSDLLWERFDAKEEI